MQINKQINFPKIDIPPWGNIALPENYVKKKRQHSKYP